MTRTRGAEGGTPDREEKLKHAKRFWQPPPDPAKAGPDTPLLRAVRDHNWRRRQKGLADLTPAEVTRLHGCGHLDLLEVERETARGAEASPDADRETKWFCRLCETTLDIFDIPRGADIDHGDGRKSTVLRAHAKPEGG